MRKSLEAERFPVMRFELARVVPDDPSAVPAAGTDLGAMLRGTLTVHGVTRDVAIPAHLRFSAGTVHVRGDFPLDLKDYQIGGLSKMLGVIRMDENTVVHLDLTFDAR